MLSEEVIDKVVERLANRIDKANEYILKEIGASIKKVGTITPSKRNQLIQALKYGGDYDKIVEKLAKITNMNVYDIYRMFDEVAKNDYRFAKQFYDYRDIKYIPYSQNLALQNQIRALASMTANEYLNFTNTKALGFGWVDEKTGEVTYKGLQETYYDLLDEAVLSISQGKETFDSAMYRQLKNIGESGLKVIYESGRAIRLDSAVRMSMKSALTNMHMEMQKQLGEEFDSDGVEISVHSNPAPDHEEAQGKQFSTIKPSDDELSEFDKLQTTGVATAYDGTEIDMHLELKSGDTASSFRPIGTLNCYHYIFSIVLGVSKPQYTNEQLQQIRDNNNKGFDLDGKHYTNYQGMQLQRKIETEIRKQKDNLTIGKASDNKELIDKSNTKLTQLRTKYKELNEASGLKPKLNRLKTADFKDKIIEKTSVSGIEEPKVDALSMPNQDTNTFFISKEQQLSKYKEKKAMYNKQLEKAKLDVSQDLEAIKKHNIDINGGSALATYYRNGLTRIKDLKQKISELGDGKFEDKTIVLKDYDSCKELLQYQNIQLHDDMKDMDKKLLIENTGQLYRLNEKYPVVANQIQKSELNVYNDIKQNSTTYAQTQGLRLEYNNRYFKDYDFLKEKEASDGRTNWHYLTDEKYDTIYTTTHEYGHILQRRYNNAYNDTREWRNQKSWKDFDKMTMEGIYSIAKRETNLNVTELKKKYLTDYGISKRNFEAFAEIFAGMELGIDNPLTRAMKEYLEEMNKWM